MYKNFDHYSRSASGIRCTLTHLASPPKVLDIMCAEFMDGTVLAYPNDERVSFNDDSPECPTLEFKINLNMLYSYWELSLVLPDIGKGESIDERRITCEYHSIQDMVVGLYEYFPYLWE